MHQHLLHSHHWVLDKGNDDLFFTVILYSSRYLDSCLVLGATRDHRAGNMTSPPLQLKLLTVLLGHMVTKSSRVTKTTNEFHAEINDEFDQSNYSRSHF